MMVVPLRSVDQWNLNHVHEVNSRLRGHGMIMGSALGCTPVSQVAGFPDSMNAQVQDA